MPKRFYIWVALKLLFFVLMLWVASLELIARFYTDWALILVTMALTYDGVVLARTIKK